MTNSDWAKTVNRTLRMQRISGPTIAPTQLNQQNVASYPSIGRRDGLELVFYLLVVILLFCEPKTFGDPEHVSIDREDSASGTESEHHVSCFEPHAGK